MICIIALIIAGILGIFSASYRDIAKKAFHCVFRNLTFRKCDSGADQELKAKITVKMMKLSPKAAGFTFKYFNIISWIFVILLFVSTGYGAYGLYNFIEYGNCDGPDSSAFCVFDPFKDRDINEYTCAGGGNHSIGEIKKLNISADDPSIGPEDAKVTIIMAGCFKCQYTKQEVPVINKIMKNYEGKVRLFYKDFPISSLHADAPLASEAARCVLEQGKFWEYHEILFDNQDKTSIDDLKQYAAKLNLNTTQFNECLDNHKYKEAVNKEITEGIEAGIYGTPTIFINDQIFVGPKTYKELKKAIDEELKK